MKKFFFLPVFALLLPGLLSAEPENDYVKSYKELLMVKAGLIWQDSHFNLFSSNDTKRIMKYAPNVQWNMGISLALGSFGASFITQVPGAGKDKQIYGTSSNFDMQLYFYEKTFGIDAIFQFYKSFFLSNISAFDAQNTKSGYFLRSDIAQTYLALNGYLNFNDNFSLKAVFNQTERQLKSTIAFLLMGSVNGVFIRANSSMIYPTEESQFGEYQGFKSGDSYSICVSPGFGAVLVIGNFYIAPVGFIGTGFQLNRFEVTSSNKQQFVPWVLKINLRPSIGYNSDNFFAGANFILDTVKTHNKVIQLDSYAMQWNLFAGYKF